MGYGGNAWAIRTLAVPIDEMIVEYRQAKNKEKQIDILADMNKTRPSRIAWLLNRCGLEVSPKKMPRSQRADTEFDYIAHWEESKEAAECDRLREQMRAAQSMPEFEESEKRDMNRRDMFESEDKIIERLNREYVELDGQSEKAEEASGFLAELAEAEKAAGAVTKKADPADRRREILVDAAACVCTDRNLMYGEPEDNFRMIAGMWSAYLGIPLGAEDVANMMILFKVGRAATAERTTRDTYVDIAGYAACAGGFIE